MQEDRADGDLKSRPKGDRPEYRVQRLEVGRSKSKRGKEIDSEYGVYRSIKKEWKIM